MRKNNFRGIKMLNLNELNQNTIDTISFENNFENYLKILLKIKGEYGIALSVRDTPGNMLPDSVVKSIKEIGFSNFEKYLWNAYVGLLIKGEVICDIRSEDSEEEPANAEFLYESDKYNIQLVSQPWKNGNKGEIVINGVNYSNNIRGINIVVFDLKDGRVIDSVGFDSHTRYLPYLMFHKNEYSAADTEFGMIKSLFLLQNEKIDNLERKLMSVSNQCTQLDKKLDFMTNLYNTTYWPLFVQDGETFEEARKRFFLNMKKADGVLGLAQRCESIILREVHKICSENDIQYWINFGTLIGAVRHAGFIPWDDDIDICMTREEISKFEEAIKDHEFLVLNHYGAFSWDGYIHYIRVVFKEVKNVFVDIFIYDAVSDDTPEAVKKFKEIRDDFRKQTMEISNAGEKGIYNGMLEAANSKVFEALNSSKEKKALFWSIDNYTQNIDPFLSYDDVFPLRKIIFDEYQVFAPKNYDRILRNFYGDYYSLPKDVGAPKHLKYNKEELVLMNECLKKYKR